MAGGEKKIRSDNLKAVVRYIFAKAGSLPRECDLLADHLIEANLKGHDSHGIGMIPAYIAALKVDELKLNASPRLISETGSTLVLDGGLGLGQSIANDAMAMGIERAKAHLFLMADWGSVKALRMTRWQWVLSVRKRTALRLSHCITAIISVASVIGPSNARRQVLFQFILSM